MPYRATKILFIASFCFAAVVSGCKGIKSNLVHRNESNSAWEREKLKGIPITLEVPTHVRVSIVERKSFYGTTELIPVAHQGSYVKYDFIRTKKMFTVDPKRPAAGTVNWAFDLDGQYLKKANSDITDVTIQQTSTAIANVISSGGFGTLFKPANENIGGGGAAASGLIVDPEEEKKYNHIDSIAASKIFDIEDPMFEELVAEFLKCHIPPCHAGVCHTSWDVGSDCPSEFVIPPDSSPVVPLVHGNAVGVQTAPLHGMPPTNGAAPANGGAPVNGATETRELHPKPQPPPAPKPQENTPPN